MTMFKTEMGQQVLKDRSIPLTPRQRTALVLIDGKKNLVEVMEATAAAGVSPDDLRKLVELGLVEERTVGQGPAKPTEDEKGPLFMAGYQAAVRLTAELGLKGMRMNMAVEGATNYDQLVALMPKLKTVLKPEGYAELERLLRI
jgi:hypothetical protein